MDKQWQKIVQRMVHGLGVRSGELIQVRDSAGRFDILLETLLAIERVGATPLSQLMPPDYLERLWAECPPEYLANWDQHRREWIKRTDRVLVLGGARPDLSLIPKDPVAAWHQAVHRLTMIEEDQRQPFLLVAVPTVRGAEQLGLTLAELEELLLPALGASVEELQNEIERVLDTVKDGQVIKIRGGDGHELHLEHGDRRWLCDDGYIEATDQMQGGVASNLPAGSVYTTVLEERTTGSLWLPRAGAATDVVLRFDAGRIVEIEAANGAGALLAELDSHSGEPRRVSHIGIGLNPYLEHPIGWTLVDEHVHGYLFICLGENRYMRGQNASSLNVDYAIPEATLMADGRVIVAEGKVVV
jgi:leucyl aminopeptidase (aminopeptidase T)